MKEKKLMSKMKLLWKKRVKIKNKMKNRKK